MPLDIWFKGSSGRRSTRRRRAFIGSVPESLESRALLSTVSVNPAPVVATPILVSPGSSTSPGPILTTLTPTFTWQPASGATSYLINIHNITTNTYFTQTLSGNATTTFTPPSGTLFAGDQYSWHLYAENASAGSSTTASSSTLLYFQEQVAAPATPTLVSPGSTTSPGPILTTLTPAFTWKFDSGATSYSIDIHNITTNTDFTQTLTASSTTTSFTPPSGTLLAGDQYSWDLFAANAGGSSSTSSLLYFQEQVAAPATPILVSPGSTTSPGPILTTLTPTLNWQAAAGATSYVLSIHNITAYTTFTQTLSGSTTSFAVPTGTLLAGDAYSWHLYAENAGGYASSTLLYFQEQVAAPATPTIVSPGSTESPGPILTTLTPAFTWKADSGATSYSIDIHNITTNSDFTQTLTANSTSTSFTPPSGTLLAGDAYSWNLSAANAGGSKLSISLYFQEQVALPATATLVSPGTTTSSGPILTSLTQTFTWDVAAGATSYLINIHNITTNTYFTQTLSGGSTTTFTPPTGTLLAGDQYSWHLYAENAAGSTMSALFYFQEQVAAPATPTIVSPGSTTSPGPILTTLTPAFTWKADSGATSYSIDIHNITTNTDFTQTLTASSATTSFTPPTGTLQAGDQYNWSLSAANAGGSSSTSILLYFQEQALATPIVVSPGSSSSPGTKITTLTPTFTWDAVSGATGYVINIHNITNNTYFEATISAATISNGATVSFVVPSGTLLAGDQYSWHVYAQSAGGNSMSALLYFET